MAFSRKNKRIVTLAIVILAMCIGVWIWRSLEHAPHKHSPQQPGLRHVAQTAQAPGRITASKRVQPRSKKTATLSQKAAEPETVAAAKPQIPADTAIHHTTSTPADALSRPKDTISLPHGTEHKDTISAGNSLHNDSTPMLAAPPVHEQADTIPKDTALTKARQIAVPPRVRAEPAGGVFDTIVTVKLTADKPCSIQWKTEGDSVWNVYDTTPIRLEKTTTILLRAKDVFGIATPSNTEVYEIRKKSSSSLRCPADMVLIDVDTVQFCIDRYEWPDKKGVIPTTYITFSAASDSCAAAGKRLCTSDEWTTACSGPNKSPYPYGENYDLYNCVTNDTAPRPSGSKRSCKGYFDVFDMSGNCAEWTSTPSPRNNQYYNVMGGFWGSGRKSGCYDVKYSYYPQNHHNPVGFRCCRDAAPATIKQQEVR